MREKRLKESLSNYKKKDEDLKKFTETLEMKEKELNERKIKLEGLEENLLNQEKLLLEKTKDKNEKTLENKENIYKFDISSEYFKKNKFICDLEDVPLGLIGNISTKNLKKRVEKLLN